MIIRSRIIAFIVAISLALSAAPLGAQDGLLGDILGEEADAARSWSRDSVIEVGLAQAWRDKDPAADVQDWGAMKGPSIDLDAITALSFLPPALPALEHGPLVDFHAALDTAAKSETGGNPFIVGDDFSARADSGWTLRLESSGATRTFLSAALLGGFGIKGFTESDPAYLPTGADPEDFWFRVQTRLVLEAAVGLRSKRFDATLRERYVALREVGSAYGLGAAPGFEQSFGADMDLVLVDDKACDWSLGMEASFDLDSRIVVPQRAMDFDARMDLDFKDIGRARLVLIGWERESELPGLDAAAERAVQVEWFGKVSWKADMADGDWTLSFRWPYAASLDGASVDGRWELGLSSRLER